VVDQLVGDFAGTIDEDDARCMVREAAVEALGQGLEADEDFDLLPPERSKPGRSLRHESP
jgi:hypothetical protein